MPRVTILSNPSKKRKVGSMAFWGTYPVTVREVIGPKAKPTRYAVEFENGKSGWVYAEWLTDVEGALDSLASNVYHGNPKKNKQYTFREFGGIALLRARDVSRVLESDGYFSIAGEIPSGAGSSFVTAYIITNAPAPMVRKISKRYSLTMISTPARTIRKNPCTSCAHTNPRKRRMSSSDSSVRSPTRTSTDVRSPTRTSTRARTTGNVTVTGGAGRGATTTVRIQKNPPKGQVMSQRVMEIRYRHIEDGKLYKHPFGPGVCAAALGDGTVLLYHKNGKPLTRNF